MRLNKKAVTAAVIAALGSVGAVSTASAAIANGNYNMVILTTPISINVTPSTTGGAPSFTVSSYNVGSNGNWNSTFTFGTFPGGTSNGMSDNAGTVTGSDGVARGSSIGGDGFAGKIGITVNNGTFSVNGLPLMSGTIDQTTNAMTFTPNNRFGAISSPNSLYNKPWNINNATCTTTGCVLNSNTAWSGFTTGTQTGPSGPITGKVFTTSTDQNGDGLTDYLGVLVSTGNVGSTWDTFFGAKYYETWRVRLISSAGATSGFSVDMIPGTAGGDFGQYATVPIPAAAWLFGSGLMGLAAVARRKKKNSA